ncbi:MAG: pseudouridine synthase [Mangrovibacterium sp.]
MREQNNRGRAPQRRSGSDSRPGQQRKHDGERREYKKSERRTFGEKDAEGRPQDRKPFRRTDGKSFSKKGSDGGRDYSFPRQEGERTFVKKKAYEGKNFKKDYKKLVKQGVDTSKPLDTRLRLNRYISNAGVCSRRDADKLILDGEITVNGKVITEMGYRLEPQDKVLHNGKRIIAEQKVYLLLNKPKGFVTTLDDPHADKTVMDLVKDACTERIYPVGRLDKATTGLLLFTNDGNLAKKLTHPSYQKKKIYHVFLKEKFPEEHLEKIYKGIELEDGFVKADAISYVDPADKTQVGIEIHSGRNRIVRRIFEHFGFRVQKLDRVFFAGLTKKNLPRGKYRFLTPQEINFLKMS